MADHAATCPACQILDRADGVEDGRFVALPQVRTKHAGKLFAKHDDSFGRFSESVARGLGTGKFLGIQTAIVMLWIGLNLVAISLQWDPYPFILLNLAFSTQAAYAAPLILLAGNRQAARDKVAIDLDYVNNIRSEVWAVHIGQSLGIDAEHVEAIVAQAVAESRGDAS
jgi:uncharacterized membrane protein